MNIVILYGNVTQPPDHGQTKTGVQYCNFSIGIREVFKKKNYKDKSLFIDCVVYGETAEFMKKCGQGDEVLVYGQIDVQSWKDKTDRWQKKYRVNVNKFILPKDKSQETAIEYNGIDANNQILTGAEYPDQFRETNRDETIPGHYDSKEEPENPFSR